MRILYLSELGYHGKISNNDINWRNDVTLIYGLNADNCNYGRFDSYMKDQYDIIIADIPKNHPEVMDLLLELANEDRKYKIGIVQEGGYDYFLEWNTENQVKYIQLLKDCDFFLTMNEYDKNFYELLTNKPVYKYNTPIRLDKIERFKNNTKEDKVMIGGNLTAWYSGTISLKIAEKFNLPIYMPTMGRRHPDEDEFISLLTYNQIHKFPYMLWEQWMENLSTFKYAVHMMPIAGAGTFSINCAALGIPCIGRKNIDNQRILFPSLCVDETFTGLKYITPRYVINHYDDIIKYAQDQLSEFEYKAVCEKMKNFFTTLK